MRIGLHQSVSNAEICTKNSDLCSFKLEKDMVFRISPGLVDLEKNVCMNDITDTIHSLRTRDEKA
jgi:hypothetical protein